MRRFIPVLLAVLPGVAPAQGTTQPSVLVTTETPRQGALPRTLTAYGVVKAAPDSSEALSLLRAGQVTRVMAAVGQRVHQDQPLLVITADPAALATYRQAVAALTLARGERARLTQMLEQQLATRDQLAVADKATADAQGNLDLLKRGGGASAAQTLTAPFEGVVSALFVVPGARIAAQAPLVTVDRSSRLVASIGIEPGQRGLVAQGQPAQVEPLDGGGPKQGSVLSVGAMLDPVSRLLPVLVDAMPKGAEANAATAATDVSGVADTALLLGGPVRVVVQVGEFRGWLLPRGAVAIDSKGAYVFQVRDGKAARVNLQVTGTVGDTTVAAGPLDPKRPIVVTGNAQLQDGAAVRFDQATPSGGVAAR